MIDINEYAIELNNERVCMWRPLDKLQPQCFAFSHMFIHYHVVSVECFSSELKA
jgi:hypothetical protein